MLRARLYPEHDATPTDTLNLAPGSDGWSGVFNVLGMTPSAFVQVWVDEPATEEIRGARRLSTTVWAVERCRDQSRRSGLHL